MVWKWEAGRQKIQVNEETVKKLIDQEMLGEDLPEEKQQVFDYLAHQSYKNLKPDLLWEALTDEFRVRMAQERRLGDAGPIAAVQWMPTQDEYHKHFANECRSIDAVLLPIDVEPFLAQVKDTPTEKELQDLYDKHKKDDAAPFLDRPGFIDPKRVRLEFLAAKPDSAYFRKLGREAGARDRELIAAATARGMPKLTGAPP